MLSSFFPRFSNFVFVTLVFHQLLSLIRPRVLPTTSSNLPQFLTRYRPCPWVSLVALTFSFPPPSVEVFEVPPPLTSPYPYIPSVLRLEVRYKDEVAYPLPSQEVPPTIHPTPLEEKVRPCKYLGARLVNPDRLIKSSKLVGGSPIAKEISDTTFKNCFEVGGLLIPRATWTFI
eukprot:Gb_36519 [translate_table: standard]